MKLLACMCNQPPRLLAALAPVRAQLVAPPPVARWGLGYVHGGDTLLVRTPRGSDAPVDLAAPLASVLTDCWIAQAVAADRFAGPHSTPPFRYHRWMFAQAMAGRADALTDGGAALLAGIPAYLRRNLRGHTAAELGLHVLLGRLAAVAGDAAVDDPALPLPALRRAVADAVEALDRARAPGAPRAGTFLVSNGRVLCAARLAEPLAVRHLAVASDRGDRDPTFRGVLVASGVAPGDAPGPSAGGFEEVPEDHLVVVSRDVRVEIVPLGAAP